MIWESQEWWKLEGDVLQTDIYLTVLQHGVNREYQCMGRVCMIVWKPLD